MALNSSFNLAAITMADSNTMTETCPRPRTWCWVQRFLTGIVLALLTGAILYGAFPPQYEAKAVLLLRTSKPQFLFEPPQQSHDTAWMCTQMALMRSHMVIDKALENPAENSSCCADQQSQIVIDKALENPGIAQLPVLLKQRDRRNWLIKNLRIKRDGESELVSVSIKTNNGEASRQIVDAVVDAYLGYIRALDTENEKRLLANLETEKRRHLSMAQMFQDSISARRTQKELTAEEELEIPILQTQLARVNKILDQIEDRIWAVQAEARAPGQILHLSKAVASPPNKTVPALIAGLGAGIIFFATLLFGVVMDCVRVFCRLFWVR